MILLPSTVEGASLYMDTAPILTELRAQRDRINQAIEALESLGGTSSAPTKPGRKPATATVPTVKKRVVSAAARKKMAEAAKKRWAVKKAAEKKPAAKAPAAKKVASKKTVTKTAKKRFVSPESRQKMAEAQQKRWAKKKRAVKTAAKKAAPPVATAAGKEAPRA
jgi:hypothetical protein